MTKGSLVETIRKRKYLILLFFIALIFWVKGFGFIDPDFGWRIKAGQLYLDEGIPDTDPFSYTMSDFPWVDHAWVVTFLIGFLFPSIGMVGLSLLFLLPAIFAVYIAAKREESVFRDKFLDKVFPKGKGLKFLSSFVVILAFTTILPFSGIRAQNFSWLLLSVLLFVALSEDRWRKYRLFIPFYFLLWGNLHGSFSAGLISLFLILTFRSLRKRKLQFLDLLAFSTSALLTLINPYGLGTWREVFSSVMDSSLRWKISEWMPAFFSFNIAFLALLVVSGIFIWRYRNKIYLEEKILYLFFLSQAVASVRHVPLWVIVTIPLTSKAIYSFHQEIKKDKESLRRFAVFYKYLWYGALVLAVFQTTFVLWDSVPYSEGEFYPKDAIGFIKQKNPDGEVFSKYGWGGYLIWKIPERKVFIDGRMPSWMWEAKEGNLNSAFDTYSQIVNGEIEYMNVFEKHNVQLVLWPKPAEKNIHYKIDEKLANLFLDTEVNDFSFVEKLEKDGWVKKYQDDTAVIYEKTD